MKYIVLVAFVGILGSLAAALFFMMKNDNDDKKTRAKRMAFSLALRIGISVLLFASILVAWRLGLVSPTGVP